MWKVIDPTCKECKRCTLEGIGDMEVYQNLGDEKYYVLLSNYCCTSISEVVKEEES